MGNLFFKSIKKPLLNEQINYDFDNEQLEDICSDKEYDLLCKIVKQHRFKDKVITLL